MRSTALYCRVSTTDQHCDLQLHELHEYIHRRGWALYKEYVDTGFSGAKTSRPALDRLMADAARRRFDVVVVYKIDRFGRSVLDLNQQIATLDSHGIRFIAVSQGLDTDRKNPTSRLLLQVLAAVAEFERELICERTIAGVRAAKIRLIFQVQWTNGSWETGRPVSHEFLKSGFLSEPASCGLEKNCSVGRRMAM